MNSLSNIKNQFSERFHSTPRLYSSPARVNLIGEHTDYNDGFVLPASVSKSIYFALAPNGSEEYHFYANDLSEEFQTTQTNIEKSDIVWANYLLGVIWQFKKLGITIPGFDCVFGGDIPLGAGMSSSAALECGLAFAINDTFEYNVSRIDLVKMAQKAEHEYAGVQCGIMDQFAVMHGQKNQVIKLDCRSLEHTYYPFNMSNYELVLVNSGVKHALASSEYNIRREECQECISILNEFYPDIISLRDVSLELLNAQKDIIPERIYARASYVIEENTRLQNACEALLNEDMQAFGKYMDGSHNGLCDKYEVSCPELDQLVEIARNTEGVLGSRMMGGGFGGCTINLIQKEHVEAFNKVMNKKYKTPEGTPPEIIKVVIEDGTKRIYQHD